MLASIDAPRAVAAICMPDGPPVALTGWVGITATSVSGKTPTTVTAV